MLQVSSSWFLKKVLIKHIFALASQSTANSDLKVFFMKKLWVDAIPAEEVIADVKFHFPQVCFHSYSM